MSRFFPHTSLCSLVVLTSVFFVVFSGCQVYNVTSAFVVQRYTNTISYFNTYYNAQRAFNDGEDDVLDFQKSRRGKVTAQDQTDAVPQSARQKFSLAIEKGSKLLSFYPDSKWVDDALVLIGKSYYYLGDDLKAERKFLELFSKYPGSDLRYEAELWYGRSLLRQKRYDQGIQLLENLYSKALQDGEKDIAGLASSVLGRHYMSLKEYEKAVKHLQQAIAVYSDDVTNAEYQYSIGLCYEQMGEYGKAMEAFNAVDRFSPDYFTAFHAQFQSARMLELKGEYDEALRRIDEFLTDTKNTEYFPTIHYEIATIYMAQGKTEEAIARYTFLDTTFARTNESAKSYFKLGQIFETGRNDYAKAKTAYDKAKTEFPASDITSDAARKSETFTKYFTLTSDLARYDSLLAGFRRKQSGRDSVGVDTSGFRQSPGDPGEDDKTKPPLSEKVRMKGSKDSTGGRADSLRNLDQKSGAEMARRLQDSLHLSVVKTRFELAGLFYLEINQPDSALAWFQSVIDRDPENDLSARALYTIADIYRSLKKKDEAFVDSLYRRLIQQYPRSPYAEEARKLLGLPSRPAEGDPAEELYCRAESCMERSKNDSAILLLRTISRQYSSSPFSAKAMYSLGWLYENSLQNRDSASAVYRRLIQQFPDSKFAQSVQPKIREEDQAKKDLEQKKKEGAQGDEKKSPKEESVGSAPASAKSSTSAPPAEKHE